MRKEFLAGVLLACCQMAYSQVPTALPPANSPHPCKLGATPAAPASKLDHLSQAAEHLEAAGLSEEAHKLRQLAEEEKQALLDRIEGLQEEVERLRQLVGPPQVLVQVKMVEISRGKLRKLGFDFAQAGADSGKTGPGRPAADQPLEFGIIEDGDPVVGVLEALRQDRLLRVLAEPTLMTQSGRPASIQVGGEVPTLVPQEDGKVAIEYKPYGTRVDLLPTVFRDRKIRLEVRVRVSKLDPGQAVQVQGQTCPAMDVREVDTRIELASGQTAVLGGLVGKRTTRPVGVGLPAPGDASQTEVAADEADDEETELLVLVKPEIVGAPGESISAKRPGKPLPEYLRPLPAPAAARALVPAEPSTR